MWCIWLALKKLKHKFEYIQKGGTSKEGFRDNAKCEYMNPLNEGVAMGNLKHLLQVESSIMKQKSRVRWLNKWGL